jgi:hypothetical protein
VASGKWFKTLLGFTLVRGWRIASRTLRLRLEASSEVLLLLELLGFIGLLEFIEFIVCYELRVSSYELLIPNSAIRTPQLGFPLLRTRHSSLITLNFFLCFSDPDSDLCLS